MPSILLVEDTEDLARLICRELERAGHEVRWAASGEEGLARWAEESFDLIILDWMLPGIDGLAVLRRIRGSSDIPVIMLTARAEELDRVMGLELGADDYLVKPFSMRELIARVAARWKWCEKIREQVARDRDAGGEILSRGALSLDPESRSARLADREIELTGNEFDLLHLLLRHPGRAFSRQYLLDAVWGQEVIITDRSVDNVILKLRKKLGEAGRDIETVWGHGYRLRREP